MKKTFLIPQSWIAIARTNWEPSDPLRSPRLLCEPCMCADHLSCTSVWQNISAGKSAVRFFAAKVAKNAKEFVFPLLFLYIQTKQRLQYIPVPANPRVRGEGKAGTESPSQQHSMTFKGLEPWRKTLYVIWLSQFITMMGMSLVIPFLPFYVRDLGVTDPDEVARWSGFAFSGPFILSFFMIPVWGFLGDRYGRKLMVVRAVFGLAVSQVLIGFSQNVEMLFLFRMLQGAISGFIAASLALVSANSPREKAGYAIGVLQASTASGNIIGPLIGGSLADAFGYRPLFFLVAGICTVAGILVIKMVKEDPSSIIHKTEQHSLFSNYRFAFKSANIRVAMLVILLTQAAVMMIQPIFALYIESLAPEQTLIATLTGAVFSIAGFFMVLSSPWWGRRNDIKSYRTNLTIAISGAAVAYVAQGFATSPYHLLPLRALQGLCMGGILPSLYSYVSKQTEMARRGGIMGIASSFQTLANMVGPIAGGYIAATNGLRGNFFITGAVLAAAVIFVRFFFTDSQGVTEPILPYATPIDPSSEG